MMSSAELAVGHDAVTYGRHTFQVGPPSSIICKAHHFYIGQLWHTFPENDGYWKIRVKTTSMPPGKTREEPATFLNSKIVSKRFEQGFETPNLNTPIFYGAA